MRDQIKAQKLQLKLTEVKGKVSGDPLIFASAPAYMGVLEFADWCVPYVRNEQHVVFKMRLASSTCRNESPSTLSLILCVCPLLVTVSIVSTANLAHVLDGLLTFACLVDISANTMLLVEFHVPGI